MSMWGKRRDEEQTPQSVGIPRLATAAPDPLDAKKEAASLSSISTPIGKVEPDARGGSATIGKAVRIAGQIFSKEDLYVDGDVEGTVEVLEHKLTVGPNGKVQASIKAREVVVLGSIQGNVDAGERLEIRKDGKLIGDIRTSRIIIEDGAYFKGSIDIVRPEPAKPAAAAAAARPQPATPAASAPVPAVSGVEAKR